MDNQAEASSSMDTLHLSTDVSHDISSPEILRDQPSIQSANASFSVTYKTGSPGVTPFPHELKTGSPGGTPFPHELKDLSGTDGTNGHGKDQAIFFASTPVTPNVSSSSMISSIASSANCPPVPNNSPDDSAIQDFLAEQAKKQEEQVKKRLRSDIDNFKTPSRIVMKRPKKRLRLTEEGTDLSSIPMATPEDRISVYNDESLATKRRAKRASFNAAIDLMKKLVPGTKDMTEESEIFEMTSKYVLFLKKRIGDEFDKEFLEDYLPYESG